MYWNFTLPVSSQGMTLLFIMKRPQDGPTETPARTGNLGGRGVLGAPPSNTAFMFS
jgi:hypothetical protein